MSEFKRKYNIYCDESSVENNLNFFTIGALFISRDQKKRINNEIKQIQLKHEFHAEIKWNKVCEKYKSFYDDLIKYFVEENDLEFKSILIEKNKIDLEKYHHSNNEEMFYKFYYQLLKRRFKNDCEYSIVTDFKTRKHKLRLIELLRYLRRFIRKKNQTINIKHLQEYDSNNITLLQLSDFFTGMVAYANNYSDDKSFKYTLYKSIQDYFEISLNIGTNQYFEKFNLFKWTPRKIQ